MNEGETTAEELRELIRQGHGMVKDLVQAEKSIRRLMTEAQAMIAEAEDAPQVETQKRIREVCDEAMQGLTDELVDVASKAQEVVQTAIYERFDVLMDVLLGYDKGRREMSVPDLIRARVTPPKLDLDALDHLAAPIDREK